MAGEPGLGVPTDNPIQFATNVYLSMAEKGGALILWPDSLSRDQYEAYRIPGSYGVQQGCLTGETR